MRAEPTLAAAATTTGPTSPEAHRLGDTAGLGTTDGDPAGEPRNDAVADIAALLTPSRGEEPRSGTRQDWFGAPDMLRAPEHESDLPTVTEAILRRDPRLAPDPGLDPLVANLLEQACLPGDLPPHPDNTSPRALWRQPSPRSTTPTYRLRVWCASCSVPVSAWS